MKCGHCPRSVRFGLFYEDEDGKKHYACLPCAKLLGPKLARDFVSESLQRVADQLVGRAVPPV